MWSVFLQKRNERSRGNAIGKRVKKVYHLDRQVKKEGNYEYKGNYGHCFKTCGFG